MRALALSCAVLAGCGSAAGDSAWWTADDDPRPPDASIDGPGDTIDPQQTDGGRANGCPVPMARVQGFCVDPYEAYVVEIDDSGGERPHSPFLLIQAGVRVRAKVGAGVVPQGYISQVQATEACNNAGKRLCTASEFALACRGSDPLDWYPYGGQARQPGVCNEGKGSSVAQIYGPDPSRWTYENFNDPRLNQLDGGLAVTGHYALCVSPYGVHDCVGNLHEWGADPADPQGHGRFRGGFYGDAENNGHGCQYVTSAHELSYHDYSTGFRCCADATD
jgi:formylglycine-generating enzyme